MPPAPKSLLKSETPAAGGTDAAGGTPPAPAGAPDAAAQAAIDAAANNRSANEGARFETPPASERPEYVPEKFWKDGKVDLETAFSSYKELETRFTTKTEDLLKQLDAERRKGLPEAPDKYEIKLPENAPVSAEDLSAHPAIDFWRKTAFEAGLPPEKFNEGVTELVGILTAGPDLEAERAALGENADARIAAVGNWAKTKLADDEDALNAVRMIGSTADGIRALEKLMGGGAGEVNAAAAAAEPEISPEKVREWQQDPRYWDRTRRDAAFVQKVDAAFAKLYPAKK